MGKASRKIDFAVVALHIYNFVRSQKWNGDI